MVASSIFSAVTNTEPSLHAVVTARVSFSLKQIVP